jgi:hypothetical protein
VAGCVIGRVQIKLLVFGRTWDYSRVITIRPFEDDKIIWQRKMMRRWFDTPAVATYERKCAEYVHALLLARL